MAKSFSERTESERRTGRINMKVLPSIKEQAERNASEDGRTLSNYIERLIVEDSKRRNNSKV